MERAPQPPKLNPDEIRKEIAKLEHEIISMEDSAVLQHEELGTSPEDNADEEVIDRQQRDITAFQIQGKRARLSELRDMLAKQAA